MHTRRDFLKAGLGGLAVAGLGGAGLGAAVAEAAPSMEWTNVARGDRALVVIQLSGGNDGLNTVIPLENDIYHAARPTIGIRNPLRLDGDFGLNPSMRGFKQLFDEGALAIVHGCGYPQPNRSHYKALEIWHTANIQGHRRTGWLGEFLDGLPVRGLPAVSVGRDVPQALVGNSDRYVRWPAGVDGAPIAPDAAGLEASLAVIRECLAGPFAPRVFCCEVSGFDTHANQAAAHSALLGRVSASIQSFYQDLIVRGLNERVLVLCFSEFGRRVGENSSGGTDHGAAGPMFLIGGKVSGGFHGSHPSLEELDDGDLKYTTDFRRVYATVLERWLGTNSTSILQRRFEPLALFEA